MKTESRPQQKNILPINAFSIGIFLLLICSCSSTPLPKFDIKTVKSLSLEIKTVVKDLRKSKSNTIDLSIIAVRPDRLRMEATTPLGFHLASLTLNNNEVRYALTRQKKFFKGVSQPRVLRPMINVNLDPRIILQILFEQNPTEGEWECRNDENGFLLECEDKRQNIKVTWIKRTESSKLVHIETSEALLKMKLKDFQPNVQVKEKVFTLNAPKGFRIFRIKPI